MPETTNTPKKAENAIDAHLYKLAGKKPVPCSMEEWAQFMKSSANRIIEQRKVGKFTVSTIFTGIDRNFGNGPKLLFETTVLGLEGDLLPCWRYSSWNQAIKGQRQIVLILETKGIDALFSKNNNPQKIQTTN